jgi:DNA-binding response OmpR family regulator
MKKILIIEDDQIVANVYRHKLTVEGYQTEVALDGETGLKTLRTLLPDLIVLDLMLPRMSGVDVIREIRSESEFSKLPIIVFSNTYLTNMVQQAWKAGANKCLSKTSCSQGGSGRGPQHHRPQWRGIANSTGCRRRNRQTQDR